MRVRHLTDIEIQALLDRRTLAGPDSVTGERYRKDLDSQEHLDNCPLCRGELETYRELYGELNRATTVTLPRNFARKVTFSLPPFRARRTKARLQIAGIWGASLLITLFWLAGQINWSVPLLRLAEFTSHFAVQAGMFGTVIGAMIPSSDLVMAVMMSRAGEFLATIQRAFASDMGTVNLVMIAAFLILVVVWCDNLYQSVLRQRQ